MLFMKRGGAGIEPAIERKLRWFSGLYVHHQIVLFFLGRLTFPIEIRRIVRRHFEARATGKDGILFGATATENEVFHAVH